MQSERSLFINFKSLTQNNKTLKLNLFTIKLSKRESKCLIIFENENLFVAGFDFLRNKKRLKKIERNCLGITIQDWNLNGIENIKDSIKLVIVITWNMVGLKFRSHPTHYIIVSYEKKLQITNACEPCYCANAIGDQSNKSRALKRHFENFNNIKYPFLNSYFIK